MPGPKHSPAAANESLWLATAPPLPASDPVEDGRHADVVVVGGGLTGLTTALLLARAGRQVVVVEARSVGAVTTGNTTAKLSVLQGTKLSEIASRHSTKVLRAYVEANREGQAWLLRFCDDHGVDYQARDAVTYAADPAAVPKVRDELAACRDAGLPVEWRERFDVPFPHEGGVVLRDQAQFHPMEVLAALAEQVRAHGGLIHEGDRVVGVGLLGEPEVRLASGRTLHTDEVVVATGTPFLDRGLYFAKLDPKRSYAIAFDWPAAGAGPLPMFLSAGSPTRSVRDAPGPGGRKLLVGGNGHVVGRTRSEAEHLDGLREWAATYFPDAVETHAWSAQDYGTHDGVPYVGRLPRGGGRIHVATGFDKWGMTNGVAAARNLSAELLGEKPSWAVPLGRRITSPSAAARLAGFNAAVGLAQVRAGVAAARECSGVRICTHLGGILRWNDAEGSWDCPLHGSRFGADGSVLEGPATKPLRGADDDT